MGLENFYHALLGAMITIASTSRNVARAACAAGPSDPLAWEGWLQPGNDLSVTDVVSISGLDRDSTDDPRTGDPRAGHFPEARAAGPDIEDLDQLARDWIIYWLLDMGARNFEGWVGSWDRPDFLRMPDLALPEIGKTPQPCSREVRRNKRTQRTLDWLTWTLVGLTGCLLVLGVPCRPGLDAGTTWNGNGTGPGEGTGRSG
jgi:hypothetical protein